MIIYSKHPRVLSFQSREWQDEQMVSVSVHIPIKYILSTQDLIPTKCYTQPFYPSNDSTKTLSSFPSRISLVQT